MRVYNVRKEIGMVLVNDAAGVAAIKDQLHINCTECKSLFVKADGDGKYEEVWGAEKVLPLSMDFVHDHSLLKVEGEGDA